jgi:tetratricopeptide (TPR) repeat protein
MDASGRSEAQDAYLVGDRLARQRDFEGARGAFQTAISLGDPEWSPRAAYGLGSLLWNLGDPGGAEPILRVAINAGHPDWTPAAEVVQGVICAARQDVAGATRAYGAAIASEHPEHAANAWFNLGTLHQQRGETMLAVTAYRRAISFEHPELSPKAAVNLGYVLFNQLGQAAEAEAAFQVAIASDNQQQAELARQNLTAMRQLSRAAGRGERHQVVDDQVDVSVGRGKGGLKWRRWIRRDPP